MNLLATAIKAYQRREYDQALALFEEAGNRYGSELVEFNIHLCRNALSAAKAEEKDRRLLSETSDRAEKPRRNSVNNVFDRVYLLSRNDETGKQLRSAAQLRRYGVEFISVDALDGYAEGGAQTVLWASQENPHNSRHRIKPGKRLFKSASIGGYLEICVAILREARSLGLHRILILESDVVLHPKFHEQFSRFIEHISSDWKLIHLGAVQYGSGPQDESIALSRGHYAPRPLGNTGYFAIGVDSSIYSEIIESLKALQGSPDHLPLEKIYERYVGQCYVAYPHLVTHDLTGSSTGHCSSPRTHCGIEGFAVPSLAPTLAIQLTSPVNLRYFDCFRKGGGVLDGLALYTLGEDGVRPVHNSSFFDLPVNQRIETSRISCLPSADCHAYIDVDRELTERDIHNFLENQLLGKDLPTMLQTLPSMQRSSVLGRVSVVVPTYSRARNLAAALESVAQQDYPDIQLIVVSDNPPESQAAADARVVFDNFRKSYSNINAEFVQHRYNRNGAAARNSGIIRSNGEFICFLDDDDIYLPGRISTAVAALQSESQLVGAVYCGYLGWNSASDDPQRYKCGDLTRELLLLDYKKHYLCTDTVTYRRSALMRINCFDETYRRHQDLELNIRFFEHYRIGAVRHSGVRLCPEPQVVDNKLFNSDFLDLKQKFLDRFRDSILALGREDAQEVYQRHWNEVLRYVKDRTEVDDHLRRNVANGYLQIALMLGEEIK